MNLFYWYRGHCIDSIRYFYAASKAHGAFVFDCRSAYNTKTMIVFLYGPDAYRLKEKLKELLSAYRAKHHLSDMARFDAADQDFLGLLKRFVDTPSLFSSKKLAVVDNILQAETTKDAAAFLRQEMVLSNKEITVIVRDEAVKITGAWSFLLRTPVMAQKFEMLSGAMLKNWIASEAAKLGIELEPPLVEEFTKLSGGNTWMLRRELEKLSLLGKKIVGPKDARATSSMPGEQNVFKLLDSFWQKSHLRLPLLEKALQQGTEAAMIFNMLVAQSRSMMLIKNGFAHKSEAHPFVVKKLSEFSRSISASSAAQLHEKLADHDIAIKTGVRDWEDAVVDIYLEGITA